MRSATFLSIVDLIYCFGFNPRTPCGVRLHKVSIRVKGKSFNPRTPCGVRRVIVDCTLAAVQFQSTHSLRSATGNKTMSNQINLFQSTHSLRSATRCGGRTFPGLLCFNPRTPCGVRQASHSQLFPLPIVSIHALLAECDLTPAQCETYEAGFNPRTPCGVRLKSTIERNKTMKFQSTHSLRSATAPDLIHCYSTEQIILCANLPKKTVIARLLFLSIYLSIFYSQCITPIADLPGNSCELEVGAQAMFNSL